MENMKYKNLSKLDDKGFKRAVGIERELFEFQVVLIEEALKKKLKKGGRKLKLSVEDILLMMYTYYRDYTTLYKIGIYFGLHESNTYRQIKWAESVLQAYITETFDISKINTIKELIVDVMECPIQRPKSMEIQREYYSGKKKKHTIKVQIIIEADTKKIVYIAFDKGSVHDFNLFTSSTKELDPIAKILADSGYQGIQKIFKNSMTQKKKSKNNPLSTDDKELNHLISSIRISIEHVNSQLKIFRILAERYRNCIDTFISRACFICSLYNFGL